MSEEKLEPCPFCGVSDDVVINEDDGAFSPSCETCETSPLTGTVGIGWFKTKDDAIRAWNTRPIEDALLQRATSAEAMLTATENKAAEYKSWAAKAVKEADELRVKIAELETEKAESDYIIKAFGEWTGNNGCPKTEDADFPCQGEREWKPEENDDMAFDSSDCAGNECCYGCWPEYYRWKYRQKLEKEEKKAGE